jgi:predicted porin
VWSRINVPLALPASTLDADSLGVFVEGRYRLTPRIMVSGRADRLTFSRVDVAPNLSPTWDANVTRVEVDGGYYIQRNLMARLAVQYNDRNGGRVHHRTYFSGQIAYWF